MANELINVNSLIIPMDETYQDNGMYKSYGLVYSLLKSNVPVKWAIQPGKAYNGTDFTASAVDIQSLAPIVNFNYSGGPFIITDTNASAALPIITAWQTANPSVKVHRATASFNAPIASTMNRAPKIAIEENNSSIMIGYLDSAGIPDSNGNAWPKTSPDILTPTEVGQGAFFGYSKATCRKLVYDIFLSPHTADTTWSNATNAAELDLYLKTGGTLHATCHSISAIENIVGPFLTTAGIPSFPNKGKTFFVDLPDFPSAQALTTTQAVQGLPGGSEQTWQHTAVTYNTETSLLAHFVESAQQYDFMIAGAYKNGTGAGKIIYEGGHQYGTYLPYSKNADGPYLRFVLDSIFLSVSKPWLYLMSSPSNLNQGLPNTITFTIANNSGSTAINTNFTVTLIPGMTYNAGSATITPDTISGQTLIWNALGSTAPGTILTFTANYTPATLGVQQIASFGTSYSDTFNDENYTLNYCISSNVIKAGNLPPTVPDYFVNTPVNVPVSGTVVGTDPNGDPLTYSLQTSSGHGTVIVNANGNWTYTPNPFFVGTDSFRVLVDDGNGGTAISTVNITVISPILAAQKTVDKSTAKTGDILTYSITITNLGNTDALNVMFTDPFPPSTALVPNSFTINGIAQIGVDPSSPVNIGTIIASGSILLGLQVKVTGIPTPPSFIDTAFMDYKYLVNNVTQNGSSTSNSVTTTGVNTPPTVPDYNVTTPINTPVSGTVVGTDADGNPLTYTLNSPPSNGTVVVNLDGTWTYTPNLSFTGIDSFQVTVSDGKGGTAISTVTINVNAPKFNPIKTADKTNAKAGDVVTYTVSLTNNGSVAANNVTFTDNIPVGTTFVPNSVFVNGSQQSGASPITGVLIGTIGVGTTINITFQATVNYQPTPPQYVDQANFAYVYQAQPGGTVLNGNAPSNKLSINALNNPPTVPDYTVITPVNTSVGGTIVGSDVDPGDVLTYTLNTSPANGGVTVNTNGNWTYTPNLNFIGTDIFTVTVSDGKGGTAISTVTVNVNAPMLDFKKTADKTNAKAGDIVTYSFTITNNGNVAATNIMFSDPIPTGTSFVANSFKIGVTSVPGADPAAGVNIGNLGASSSVTVSFQVLVVFKPTPPQYVNIGTLDYQYKPSQSAPPIDASKDSNTITVNALNNPPTVPDYTVTTPLNTPVSGTVVGHDVDPGDTLTYALNASPTNGSVTVNPNGNWTYIPNSGFIGVDTFKVLVSDGHGGTAVSTITVNVNGAKLNAIKTSDKSSAKAGDIITYSVAITNAGNVTAANVIFTDSIPAGTTLVANSFKVNGLTKPGADPSLGINIGNINAGITSNVSFQVQVQFKPLSGVYNNEASMSYTYRSDPQGPDLPGNDSSNKTTTTALNNPPTVPNYNLTTNVNTPVSGNVVGTDVDPGDTLVYSLNSSPSHGTVLVNLDGSFTYTPSLDFLGTDSFTVLVSDGHGGTATSTITINVNAPKLSMVKTADKTEAFVGDVITYSIAIKNIGTADAQNVIFKDTPPAGTNFVVNSFAKNGSTILNASPALGVNIGSIAINDMVTVSFQVKVISRPDPPSFINVAITNCKYQVTPGGPLIDGFAESNEITTVAKNTPPTVPNYEVSTDEGTPVSGTVVGTDVNGDTLIYSLNTAPLNGSVIINPDGNWTYTPKPGICGVDIFTVLVDDGHGGTAISTITVTVKPPLSFKQFSVMEDVEIPASKPDMEDIITVSADVVIISTTIIKTPISTSYEGQHLTGYKAIVEGKIVQKIEYIAKDTVQSVHAAEFEMPFSNFIVLPYCYKEDTPVIVQGIIEDIYSKMIDSRHLFKNITLRIEASVNF